MGFGPPEEDENIRVAAARPKALPMADGRTIGNLALAAATQLLVAHFQRSAAELRHPAENLACLTSAARSLDFARDDNRCDLLFEE